MINFESRAGTMKFFKTRTEMIRVSQFHVLTLIREFLGPLPSVICGKKSAIITGDVTVGTWEIKIISADRVSVGLSFDTYFKWHLLT